MLNLLSNAIKYNHPGGQVTVTVDDRPGEQLRISVTDTGRGVSGQDVGRLFLPFERLDAAQAALRARAWAWRCPAISSRPWGAAPGSHRPGRGQHVLDRAARHRAVAVSQLP